MKFKNRIIVLFLCCIMTIVALCNPLKVQAADSTGVNMFRMYNPNTGEHFYTSDVNEADSLESVGWDWEGVGWVAPQSGNPVYRLFNPNAEGGDHHYTMNESEKDMLVSVGWNYEGIGWYSDVKQTVPVYREYNPNATSGTHNYTTSENEHNSLCSQGWKNEDIAWYALDYGFTYAPTEITIVFNTSADDTVTKMKKIGTNQDIFAHICASGEMAYGDDTYTILALGSGDTEPTYYSVPYYDLDGTYIQFYSWAAQKGTVLVQVIDKNERIVASGTVEWI